MTGTRTQPLFADLVFNEEGERAKVVIVGGEPFYAIPDNDFLRHVEASHIDRQIVAILQQRIRASGDTVADGIIQMLGDESLFTRASIAHAINHMDEILNASEAEADQLRTALWMAGFRVIVDIHGDVLRLQVPGWDGPQGP